jgi:hypothetical protein
MQITVPRIGSAGKIWDKPCVVWYTVKSGDTWASIAQQYNADVVVLQKANPVALTAGTQIKVPRNSAGATIGINTPVPGATTAAPTASTIMQITFDPGQTTATRVGVINPGETLRYMVNATQGQLLSLTLTAPANEVAIGVNGPTGLVLKPLDGSPTWNTTVTTGGAHYINLQSLTGGSSKSYTLTVSLTGAGAAATNTPGTPAAP